MRRRTRSTCRALKGAKQAVDQIFDLIQFKSVTNLKGAFAGGLCECGSAHGERGWGGDAA